MKGWLKIAGRLIRLDRIHEFWVERSETGYVIKAAVYGSQDVMVGQFNTYDEAERILNAIFQVLQGNNPMVDVTLLLEEEWEYDELEDIDFGDFPEDDLPEDDIPF
ncbi:MAG: hypothetical protein GXO39_08590 [Thermotogae bacterium]|nr:hypothetical protein [Thermotogota bacterium]